ncbi:DUF1989 domain-containing protein [Bdellovibrio bacteriovorus]|uniref:DUF1989 domain-containing protein n=1 Tax=Bdellovibrio bacteriovorus TaxID=959 RepID=UPI003A80FD84
MEVSRLSPFCRIPAQHGAGFRMSKGQKLRVVTPEDMQVADLFCYAISDVTETLSSGRSIDYNDTIYLTQGHDLYSNRSNVMLSVLQDSCGRHDFLMTPCSLRMFQIVSGSSHYHPSCHENLVRAFQELGVEGDTVGTTFNLFMNVAVDSLGLISIQPPLARAGDYILLQAQMDLHVGLTACSHPETNHFHCKPIHYRLE